MRSLSLRCTGQFRVPFRQETSEFVAEGGPLDNPPIQVVKALPHELANAPARRSAAVSCGQHALQVLEREAHDEGALNQQDAFDGGRRVAAVPTAVRSVDTPDWLGRTYR